MEKYWCYQTQFCNIIVLKLKVTPNPLGPTPEWKVLTRHSPGRTLIKIPYYIKGNEAFDTFVEAEVYAKILCDDLKDKCIKKIEKSLQHQQKRLDKMKAKVPSIRRIVCG